MRIWFEPHEDFPPAEAVVVGAGDFLLNAHAGDVGERGLGFFFPSYWVGFGGGGGRGSVAVGVGVGVVDCACAGPGGGGGRVASLLLLLLLGLGI